MLNEHDDDRLRAVADRVEIADLQARYGDAVTRRAWGELPALFSPACPVHLDLRRGTVVELVGGAAVGAFISSAIERFEFFEFALLNAVVDLGPGPDEASGRVYIWELRQLADGHRWTNAYGLYRDRYARVEGRWVFARRDYSSLARVDADGTEVFDVPG